MVRGKKVLGQMEMVLDAGQGWCRANQHIWQHPAKKAIVVEKGNIQCVFRCATCGGERIDHYGVRTGELNHRTYRMPEGYILKKVGDARPSKSDWRKAHYGRLVG